MDEKVYKGLKILCIKSTQGDLQKCITQFKKSRKGRHEWNKTYNVNTLGKLNIPMKTKYLFIFT